MNQFPVSFREGSHSERNSSSHRVQAEPYRQGTVPPFGSPLTSQGCINTQPGLVHELPNLHGFVPAPGIDVGSAEGAGGGGAETEEAGGAEDEVEEEEEAFFWEGET